MKDVQGPL